MIKISIPAKKYLIKLLSKQKKNTNIRIFVNKPGTINAECGISYCTNETIKKNDIEIKFNKFSIFVDFLSKKYFLDAKIDLIQDNLGKQLSILAPNIKKDMCTKQDNLFDKINHLIQSEINIQLAYHGGKIKLIDIDKDKYALIIFEGGCNGCAMSSVTLKKGVEKELLKNFPDLKGVKDITNHQAGDHSFY